MDVQPMRGLPEVLRDEMVVRDKIKELLAERAMSVPQIAEALGAPGHEVMLWVMAMWRYGTVVEVPKGRTEDYFTYRLKDERGEA